MVYLIIFFQLGVFQMKEVANTPPVITVDIYGLNATSLSDTFPDFRLPDEQNRFVELYKMKLKAYTLVTLWDSECRNCDLSFKNLHSLYNEYQKKLSFISVANDRIPGKWKSSVEKYQIEGINLVDTKGFLNKKMTLDSDRQFVLLGKNFKILEKFSTVDKLKERLEDYYFISDGLNIRNEPQ